MIKIVKETTDIKGSIPTIISEYITMIGAIKTGLNIPAEALMNLTEYGIKVQEGCYKNDEESQADLYPILDKIMPELMKSGYVVADKVKN